MSLNVAAYCRVSTDREDQANSLHSQQSYFRAYIEGHEDWILKEIYVDEGKTGTSTCKREAFNRMIRDAGDLDLILTKEVSRFARNTVDTLSYTRALTRRGVGVIFISDNIDTRDNDGELRLTIMASMAQEESRKTSERVKWGQKRRMEAGVVFGNNSTFGFETQGGKLTVREDEATVVRLIYHKCVREGKGTHIIARELYEEGIDPPQSTSGKWSATMIRRVLRNEKYVGDLLQKKFITTDYLTHKKEENRGREAQVYLRDHHTAIVERALWDAAQKTLACHRAQGESRYSARYWCSGKIRCGDCGSRFVLRKSKRPNGGVYQTWGCHSRVQYGNWKRDVRGEAVGCNMRMLNDKTLTVCVRFVLQQLDLDRQAIVSGLLEELEAVWAREPGAERPARLEEKRAELERKKERVMDAYFGLRITAEEMARMKEKYDAELSRVEAGLRHNMEQARVRAAQAPRPQEIAQLLREELDCGERVFAEVIEGITVFGAYIDVQVYGLAEQYRLFYSTCGAGENYTVKIEKWDRI